MSEIVASLGGWLIGMSTAILLLQKPHIEHIQRCERENILTENQECVLSAKVVESE